MGNAIMAQLQAHEQQPIRIDCKQTGGKKFEDCFFFFNMWLKTATG